MKPVLVYGGIRVLLFAVVLAALLLIQVNPFVAAALAAVIAFCVSYIAFGRQRRASADALAARRPREQGDHVASAAGDDESAEDAAVDRALPGSADER